MIWSISIFYCFFWGGGLLPNPLLSNVLSMIVTVDKCCNVWRNVLHHNICHCSIWCRNILHDLVTGLTVLKADEVYDIMERDYPEKFKVCSGILSSHTGNQRNYICDNNFRPTGPENPCKY